MTPWYRFIERRINSWHSPRRRQDTILPCSRSWTMVTRITAPRPVWLPVGMMSTMSRLPCSLSATRNAVVARRNDEHDVATAMLTLSHEKRRCHKPSPGNSLSRSLLAHAMPEEAGTVAAEVSVRYTLSKEFDTWQVGPNNFSGFF